MSFSERLKELRVSRNLTQKQVYEAVGMSAIGYQRYEYGTRAPAYQNLVALAKFFDVSIDYLVGATDDPKQSLETVHTIPKKSFPIQGVRGNPHKNYQNDFSVEIRGNIPQEALKELEDFINKLKNKYVYSEDQKD